MSGARRIRLWRWLVLGGMLAPLAGCTVLGDLLNTSFLVDLGIDPATVVPSQGTIIVAFKNSTQFAATFSAFESRDALDPTLFSKNFSVEVEGGAVKNEVLDCPVGLVSPGTLGADFAPDTAQAAIVQVVNTGQQQTTVTMEDVAYGGEPLVSGVAYTCGDVISIELQATTTTGQTGNQQQFRLVVQVIPGR